MDDMGRERDQEEQDDQADQEWVGTFDDDILENAPNPPVVGPEPSLEELRQKVDEDKLSDKTKKEVYSFYNEIKKTTGLEPTIDLEETNIFSLDSKGRLHATDNGKEIRLTKLKKDKSGQKFLALSSLEQEGVGRDFIRHTLGLKGYKDPANEIIEETKAVSENMEKITSEDGSIDKLDGALDQLQEIAEQSHNLDPEDTNSEFTLREIRGFNQSLQTIRGQLKLVEAKIASVKENIRIIEDGLKEPDITQDSKELGLKSLRNLYDELEALNTQQKNLTSGFRNQLGALKETIQTALGKDLTLRERINILFREQGVTVVSILTAIGLAISTIVSSIVASVRAVGTPSVTPEPAPAPPSKGGVTDWIKRQLWNLANVLKKLGLSALGALPGIIGSILSWIFNVASKAVGWVAEHLWTLFVGLGVLLLTYVQKG